MKFYDTIEKYKDRKINIYVDMDGVIAEYDIGNFDYNTIRPLKTNIKRIEDLIQKDNIKVKILTVCKTDAIVKEKIDWIHKYMPFFDINNVIFLSKEDKKYIGISSQDLKSNYLKENTNNNEINILVDDDNSIIKHIRKNNDDIIVFQISSWID